MKHIQITNELRANSKKFSTNLFIKTRKSDFELPIKRLEKLRDDCNGNNKNYKKYIEKIIKNYSSIINADPSKMKILIKEFEKILDKNFLKEFVPYKKLKFYDSIVKAMRYEELREKEFLDYLKSCGIKTCVYCNAQLAIVIEQKTYNKKSKKRQNYNIGKLELDHFYPKSKYPFLCTSFYNLYPVCGNCNRAKSSNPAFFELYTESADLNPFNFWIDDNSILDYWYSNNHNDLKVWFEIKNGNLNTYHNHNDTFGIQGIYDTQTDLAEELLHKAKAYSDKYQKSLVDSFNKLFPDQSLVKRLVIGNYDKPEDIHKRPMAKFTQDIAKQLGLI